MRDEAAQRRGSSKTYDRDFSRARVRRVSQTGRGTETHLAMRHRMLLEFFCVGNPFHYRAHKADAMCCKPCRTAVDEQDLRNEAKSGQSDASM